MLMCQWKRTCTDFFLAERGSSTFNLPNASTDVTGAFAGIDLGALCSWDLGIGWLLGAGMHALVMRYLLSPPCAFVRNRYIRASVWCGRRLPRTPRSYRSRKSHSPSEAIAMRVPAECHMLKASARLDKVKYSATGESQKGVAATAYPCPTLNDKYF